jgi:6-phosphogluconolactonase (cycloisomerase 2 family)
MLFKRLVLLAVYLPLLLIYSCGGQGSYSGPPPGTFNVIITVSGLPSNSTSLVVVQNNNTNPLSFSGNGVQKINLLSGASYNITVTTQPSPLICSVSSGSGTNTGTNDINVSVVCKEQYVYVTNYAANSLSVLGLGQGNVLLPVAQANTGVNPTKVVIHPTGLFAYVANYTDTTISQFSLGVGSITALATPTISTGANGAGPYDMAVSPNGSYLYCVNINSGTITQFSIGASGSGAGQLTQISTPLSIGTGINSIAIDSSSTYVYVTKGGNSSAIYTFQIQANGALQQLSTLSGFFAPTAVVLSPEGKFAYVINSSQDNVGVYSVNNGNLTFSSYVSTGHVPHSIAFSPSGAFAYVTNYGGSGAPGTTLSQYSVNASSGALTPLGSPTVISGHTSSAGPYTVVVDANGGYLFDVNYNESSVSQYSISASGNVGALSSSSQDYVTGISSPTSIAIH